LDFTSGRFQEIVSMKLKALLFLLLTIPCHAFYATIGFTLVAAY